MQVQIYKVYVIKLVLESYSQMKKTRIEMLSPSLVQKKQLLKLKKNWNLELKIW